MTSTSPSDSAAPAAAKPAAETAGLTSAQAARLLAQFGRNAVEEDRPHPLRDAATKFWAPVPWMIEAAIVLQLGLREWTEAAILFGLLVFNAILGYFQESRAQAALEALRSRLALAASALRDGAWTKIPAADLVPTDFVKLSLGSIAPADVVIESGSILLDQSMLTGESAPVERGKGDLAYAGALVRRGEATGAVKATGKNTFFGRAAELVRVAHSVNAEQSAVLAVVRNLAVVNGAVAVALAGYAASIHLGSVEIVRLVLTAVLASIPVALPATFTLATALAAQRLSQRGVLPTRLAAVHEAATMDILCSDKTGTLTRNALRVVGVDAFDDSSEERVLQLAALASAEGGFDLVDEAVRSAAAQIPLNALEKLSFTPFDPTLKRAEATARENGATIRIVKGAFATIAAICESPPAAAARAEDRERSGGRVLAVAAGPPDHMRMAGLIALSDPPREDAAALIAELRALGVKVVMATGDAPTTAQSVAAAVGLTGPVCPATAIKSIPDPERYAVFAGVLPEDKFYLVQAFQRAGHTVGMCGDGANDAPALRQAQIGVAVASATDVAKSAAGIVLTQPGLSGIVEAVHEGRLTFQRILTYTLNTIIKKVQLVLFLAIGLLLTGRAVLTPILLVLLLVTNDFLTMALTTDRARVSPKPDRWRISRVTAAAAALGFCNLGFSTLMLAIGFASWRLDPAALRTLAFIVQACGGQATVYVIRERRRMWASRPSATLILSSCANLGIAGGLAWGGVFMRALPIVQIAVVVGASAAFALLLDQVKLLLFSRLELG